MFRLKRMGIDTHSEHVIFVRTDMTMRGQLGLKPLDRVLVKGRDETSGAARDISGVLNFCEPHLLGAEEIGLSDTAFSDLGLPEGSPIEASLAGPPGSADFVRKKLRGARLERREYDAILKDIAARRYTKPELSMFVLACAVRELDIDEITDLTMAMVESGSKLHFDSEVVADKHCIGGVPGNRTTMIVVPILVALGVTAPKTSSKAITSAAGTADTMAAIARVDLSSTELHSVVDRVGGCIAWGGSLDLAPADDVLITVERPMQLDSWAQMVASILAKKKTAGATHTLIDIPIGPNAKVRTQQQADALTGIFARVGARIGIELDILTTDTHGPIGRGIGPRLESIDVRSVLHNEKGAPVDLKEKSLFLAGRILERTGVVSDCEGYRTARDALESGRAAVAFEAIVEAQGPVELPSIAGQRTCIESPRDGRIRNIDCLLVNRIARLAGSPAHPSAGLRCLRRAGETVERSEPLFEIHAPSTSQLDLAVDFARANMPDLLEIGF